MPPAAPGSRPQPFDDDHRSVLTGGTDAQGHAGEGRHAVTIVWRGGRLAGARSRGRGPEEVSAAGQLLSAMTRAQEPVVADAVKPCGQDVEQKPANECTGGERHRGRRR